MQLTTAIAAANESAPKPSGAPGGINPNAGTPWATGGPSGSIPFNPGTDGGDNTPVGITPWNGTTPVLYGAPPTPGNAGGAPPGGAGTNPPALPQSPTNGPCAACTVPAPGVPGQQTPAGSSQPGSSGAQTAKPCEVCQIIRAAVKDYWWLLLLLVLALLLIRGR